MVEIIVLQDYNEVCQEQNPTPFIMMYFEEGIGMERPREIL